ncbi:hypothetical protein BBJ29_008494 [Phytophthora kernoviae]|uniref:t-SNARE coiled-coil homology domain-containing protein n=1 Tax=Phytophthora kernoviae TaxID=325452 RepID=A0A3F2RLM9_9STRA|nr:hypothetical protein BBJ29_008494 [Phytophthora kernoviae]RLN60031.1 hypothetical protein BBP00_00006204 [Phytophthora kernoviae]
MMKKELSMAAASGDPFYVFKDELESKVSAVNQKHAKWRAIIEQIMQDQDKSLAGLESDITRLHGVTVEIGTEVKNQNKMLDDLTEDVEEAQERMNFVMARLSKLLKTKDKCQLGLILFLVVVLVVMVFLVVYT